jgi:hypothetical protein
MIISVELFKLQPRAVIVRMFVKEPPFEIWLDGVAG